VAPESGYRLRDVELWILDTFGACAQPGDEAKRVQVQLRKDGLIDWDGKAWRT
jgi:hypothetical protein